MKRKFADLAMVLICVSPFLKKRLASIVTITTLIFIGLFPACDSVFANVAGTAVGCGCYCGKVISPPCSEAACKAACGWSGSSSSAGFSMPSIPSFNATDSAQAYIMGAGMSIAGQMLNQMMTQALSPSAPAVPVLTPQQIQAQQDWANATEANRRGLQFFKNKDYPSAISTFQEALNYAPNNQNFQKNLAIAQQAQERVQKIAASSASIRQSIDVMKNALGLDLKKNPEGMDFLNEDEGNPNVVDLRDKKDLTVYPEMVKQGRFPQPPAQAAGQQLVVDHEKIQGKDANDISKMLGQMTPEQKDAFEKRWHQQSLEHIEELKEEGKMEEIRQTVNAKWDQQIDARKSAEDRAAEFEENEMKTKFPHDYDIVQMDKALEKDAKATAERQFNEGLRVPLSDDDFLDDRPSQKWPGPTNNPDTSVHNYREDEQMKREMAESILQSKRSALGQVEKAYHDMGYETPEPTGEPYDDAMAANHQRFLKETVDAITPAPGESLHESADKIMKQAKEIDKIRDEEFAKTEAGKTLSPEYRAIYNRALGLPTANDLSALLTGEAGIKGEPVHVPTERELAVETIINYKLGEEQKAADKIRQEATAKSKEEMEKLPPEARRAIYGKALPLPTADDLSSLLTGEAKNSLPETKADSGTNWFARWFGSKDSKNKER